MFESINFRASLEDVVAKEVARRNLGDFNPIIVDFLHQLAFENEPILMNIEKKVPLGKRRGLDDALESITLIVEAATTVARDEGRRSLMLFDVVRVYMQKFCNIWPFCR